MKLAFAELEGWEEERIRTAFSGAELTLSKEKIDAEHMPGARDIEALSIFVESRIDAKVLDALPKLRFIATRSTGFDHIDLPLCKTRGVTVASVPGYGVNTVAEFTFGLILNLTRKIYRSIDQVKEAESFDLRDLRGIDVNGKTLGLIGTGRIGTWVARIAKGFGMRIVAFDLFPNEKLAAEFGFSYAPLETVLREADIVTLHVPYLPSTHHLINAENIRLMKRGSFLVNTSRGGVVETEALVAALKEGILAGVGLDVLEEEGATKSGSESSKATGTPEAMHVMLHNHELMHMQNVLITPHNAFNTQEALERILETTFENIRGFMSGTPVNVVSESS